MNRKQTSNFILNSRQGRSIYMWNSWLKVSLLLSDTGVFSGTSGLSLAETSLRRTRALVSEAERPGK